LIFYCIEIIAFWELPLRDKHDKYSLKSPFFILDKTKEKVKEIINILTINGLTFLSFFTTKNTKDTKGSFL